VLGKKLDHAIAKGRLHDMRNERFSAQIGDVHPAFLGQPVMRGNDEGQLVAENFHRRERLFLRHKRNHAEVQAIVEQLGRNVARKRPAHRQANFRMDAPVTGQHRQQRVYGTFVDAQGELAVLAGAQIGHGPGDFLPQIEHALGIAGQELSGVGEMSRAGAAREERLAHGFFQLADGNADRRLRTEEFLRRAGEAAFAGHGQEYVQFSQVHGRDSVRISISIYYNGRNKYKLDRKASRRLY